VKCNHCGKKGHTAEVCWLKPENAHLRPKTWRSPSEAKTVVSNANVDVLLCMPVVEEIEEPEPEPKQEVLLQAVEWSETVASWDEAAKAKDCELWIIDTGASIHSTKVKEGLFDLEQESVSILSSAGVTVQSSTVGKLRMAICDQEGDELITATMRNVQYVPSCPFNLVSATQLQSQQWTLGGNADAIWLKKGTNEVRYEVKSQPIEDVCLAVT